MDIYVKIENKIMKKIKITKSKIRQIIRESINEVYYSSGDLGIEYDPSEDHMNDYSIYDELSDDDIARIESEDEYDKAIEDDGYMNDIAQSQMDYEDNCPIDENILKIVKKAIREAMR